MKTCQDEMALEGGTDVRFNLFTSLGSADSLFRDARSESDRDICLCVKINKKNYIFLNHRTWPDL